MHILPNETDKAFAFSEKFLRAALIPGAVLCDPISEESKIRIVKDYKAEFEGRIYPSLHEATNAALGLPIPVSVGFALRYWLVRTANNTLKPLWLCQSRLKSRPTAGEGAKQLIEPLLIPQKEKGSLFVMRCPGVRAPDISGKYIYQNLHDDLAELKYRGINCVLSVLEGHEYTYLGLPPELSPELAKVGIKHLILPIKKHDVLPKGMETLWQRICKRLIDQLQSGGNVAVHSGVDLGRAGYVVARLLVEQGVGVQQSISQVREIAPIAIDSYAQELHLLGLGSNLVNEPV